MSPAAEIANTNSKIQFIEQEIERLNHQRLALLSHLNTLQSSICTLPFDIVSEIFHVLVDDSVNPTRTVLQLSAVCTSWRAKALSMPRLWTSVCLDCCPRGYETHTDRSGLLMLCSANSGGLPLHITMLPPPYRVRCAGDVEDAEETIRELLVTRQHQLESLDLSNVDVALTPVIVKYAGAENASFPYLRKLKLGWNYSASSSWEGIFGQDHGAMPLFRNAPQLQELEIAYESGAVNSFLNLFPCSQLTVLHLDGVDAPSVFSILPECLQLVEFSFDTQVVSWTRHPHDFVPEGPLCLAYVEKFRWTVQYFRSQPTNDDENATRFVPTHISLPLLRELTWGGDLFSTEFHTTDLFASSLEAPLTKITIDKTLQCTESLLCTFNRVTELYLIEDDASMRTLELLTVTTDKNGSLLPHLRILDLTLSSSQSPIVASWKTILLLYSRRNAPVPPQLAPELDDISLKPYNPRSKHWKTFSRLEKFHLRTWGILINWENSNLNPYVEDMMDDALDHNFDHEPIENDHQWIIWKW
ncbi:hypothetical protein NP233_g2344 [Leucocoprinus birnbaumii]|uniref:F-box domain-containing protein n=1 Tax=Leucocoprinus birnbaumii TaxID=56174 RepID=A0AAD5YTY6_9AGAR|nr:hypothetical protein NP233_g2344 [Leucocoprinus birnbaumii]